MFYGLMKHHSHSFRDLETCMCEETTGGGAARGLHSANSETRWWENHGLGLFSCEWSRLTEEDHWKHGPHQSSNSKPRRPDQILNRRRQAAPQVKTYTIKIKIVTFVFFFCGRGKSWVAGVEGVVVSATDSCLLRFEAHSRSAS